MIWCIEILTLDRGCEQIDYIESRGEPCETWVLTMNHGWFLGNMDWWP